MSSTITTFGIFQQLLTDAINADVSLGSVTKSSMLSRISDLARDVSIELDFDDVESVAGNAVVTPVTRSIEVATGVVGNNQITYDLKTFTVPLDIDGLLTTRGFLPGNVGASANGAVAEGDITLQYRLTSTGEWTGFDRNTRLECVTSIQFRANLADQGSDAAMPVLVISAKQI